MVFAAGSAGQPAVTISMGKRAMKLRAMAFSVACLALGVVADAQAMRTTYLWGAFPGEPDRFDSLFGQCQEGPTADLFPELCTSAGAALLSVTFVHDQPITNWDTNGCSEEMPDLCVPFRYDSILGVVISGYTSFEGTEILFFSGIDFLGACPTGCEQPPPFISIGGLDTATGSAIRGFGFGGGGGQDWVITLSFADGREYDWRGSWVRGPTVAVSEPRTAAMVALGLVAMILIHRRRRRAARPL